MFSYIDLCDFTSVLSSNNSLEDTFYIEKYSFRHFCFIVMYLSVNVECKINLMYFLDDLFLSFYSLVKGDVCGVSILYSSVKKFSALPNQAHFIIWDFLGINVWGPNKWNWIYMHDFFRIFLLKKGITWIFLSICYYSRIAIRKSMGNPRNNIFQMKTLVYPWLMQQSSFQKFFNVPFLPFHFILLYLQGIF